MIWCARKNTELESKENMTVATPVGLSSWSLEQFLTCNKEPVNLVPTFNPTCKGADWR